MEPPSPEQRQIDIRPAHLRAMHAHDPRPRRLVAEHPARARRLATYASHRSRPGSPGWGSYSLSNERRSYLSRNVRAVLVVGSCTGGGRVKNRSGGRAIRLSRTSRGRRSSRVRSSRAPVGRRRSAAPGTRRARPRGGNACPASASMGRTTGTSLLWRRARYRRQSRHRSRQHAETGDPRTRDPATAGVRVTSHTSYRLAYQPRAPLRSTAQRPPYNPPPIAQTHQLWVGESSVAFVLDRLSA